MLLPRNGRGFTLAGLVLAAAWLGYGWLASSLSKAVAGHFGAALLRIGRGKFTDPAVFVAGRARELLVLATVGFALALVLRLIDRGLGASRKLRSAAPILRGLLYFAGFNLWIHFATQTALFWIVFYDSHYVDNYAQYQIKKNLLPEQAAARHAVLLGNSQTRASIDEEKLNSLLAPRLWTTELHQPGAAGFDVLLLAKDLRGEPVDLSITYLSEIFIYGRENGVVPPHFFRFDDIPFVESHHAWSQFPAGSLRAGLVSQVLPLFGIRDSFCNRFLGGFLGNLPQRAYDESVVDDLPTQARKMAGFLQRGEAAEFAKRGFEQAIAELSGRGCRVVLIDGGCYPGLREAEDPTVRPDIESWLRTIQATWGDKVVVLREPDFFSVAAEDYQDLTHFTEAAQDRFTVALAGELERHGLVPP